MTINQTPQVVTIAGSDSGGGAGIQADLKTFQARDVFGMSIVVALTAQNTLGVQNSFPIPCEFVAEQFDSLAADFHIRACKTGMLADKEHVQVVVQKLKEVDFGPLIVDPVMIAKGGHSLLKKEAVDCIKEELLPLATVLTPNIPEAEELVQQEIRTHEEMIQAAYELQKMGVKNVVIKGGHSSDEAAKDFVLLEDGETFWMSTKRVDTIKTHGTGDTFSSCITAEIAKGNTIKEAIKLAKGFIQGAIEQEIFVGHGHGPTNHWATLVQDVIID